MKIIQVQIPIKTRISVLISGSLAAAVLVEFCIGTPQSLWLMIPTAIGWAISFVFCDRQFKQLTRQAWEKEDQKQGFNND